VFVENRGGAAGNVAADGAAKAAGDGYTLLFAQNGLAISAAALPNLPYKAETDLVPLAPVAATPHILIVGPEFPAQSVQELIARARAEPGKLAFGSSGVGNSDHLCGELFNVMAGIQALHVPYKGGAPAATDVMAGRIAYYFAGMPVGLPLAKSGRARALAVTGKQRFAGAPDIPTSRSRASRSTRRGCGRASSPRRRRRRNSRRASRATSRPCSRSTRPASGCRRPEPSCSRRTRRASAASSPPTSRNGGTS
jgi:tripartite-type tricarboxylate transporter receptor subunit TctC